MQFLLLCILVLVTFDSVEVRPVYDVQAQPQNALQNSNAEADMKWWRHVRPWKTVQDKHHGGYCFKTGVHYAYELPLFLSQAVDLQRASPLGVTHAVVKGSLMSVNGSSGSMYVLFYTKDGYPTSDPIILTDWVSTNVWVDFQFETCLAEEVVTAAIFIGATRDFVCADKNLECELALNVYANNLFIETKPYGVLQDPCKEANGNCPEKCTPILPLGTTCQFVTRCECHYPKIFNSSTNRCELPPGRCVVPSDCPFYDSILWPGTCINTTCRPPPDCVNTYEAPCIQDSTVRYCCQPGACCSIYGYCGIRPEYCYTGCFNGPCNKETYCQQKSPPKLGGEGAIFCCKDVPCFNQEHCCSQDGLCGSTEDNCGLTCSGGPCWNLTLCSAMKCADCINKGGEYCEYNEGCKCSLMGGCTSRHRKYSNITYCDFWPSTEEVSSYMANSSYNLAVQNLAGSPAGNNDVAIAIISLFVIMAVLVGVMFILNRFFNINVLHFCLFHKVPKRT